MNYLSTYVIAMLACVSFGLVNLMASGRGIPSPSFFEHLIMVAFGLLVAIPLQEAGHLLAGLALRYRCVRFGFGPLEASRVDHGWRLRLVPFRRLAMLYQVPSSFTDFRIQQATCVAAGPCLSLIACLIFATIAFQRVTPTGFWFWMVNAQMCLLGLLELVPLTFREVESDGMQLWRLYRSGELLDPLLRDLLADSVNYTELRPRDWPTDLIVRIAATPIDPVQRQYCNYLAYIHFRDAGDARNASTHLKVVLEDWQPGDPAHFALEAAYFLAFHQRALEGAREWLAQETRFTGKPIRLRAEAAIAWAEKRPHDALRLIETAEAQLRDTPPAGNRDFELATLETMREEIGVAAPSNLNVLPSPVEGRLPTTLAAAGN